VTEDRVLLSHGDGGQMMADLIARVFVSRLGTGSPPGDDAARFAGAGRLAFTTDAFVVDPIFFPGGDIGKLAICGTVNDLATAGARPIAISASFILEEGLPVSDLERIADSMAEAAGDARVQVVTGDTKVVPRGRADRVYITTAGVGEVPPGVSVSGAGARPGDVVLVSGPVGDHGLSVLSRREGLEFESGIESDCAPLGGMVQALLAAVPGAVHVLRDPTRGGVAGALNEIARQSGVEIEIVESAVPVRPAVAAACEMLGLDPLYAANEGKMLVIAAAEQAECALSALRAHPRAAEAALIGRVAAGRGRVLLETALGTHRILDRHVGEQMPRIC